MASINIYINDSLKEEMSLVEANWSEICRQAIKSEMLRLKGDEIIYEPQNFSQDKWDFCSFEANFNNDSVIIKPYVDHPDPQLRKTVKVASQWLADVKRELAIARVDGNSLGEFFQGMRRIEILEPGKTWRSGYLQISFQLNFYYENEPQNQFTETMDAEIITPNSSALSVVENPEQTQKLDQNIRIKELETLGIINIDLPPLTENKRFYSMYSEIYVPLIKALEDNFYLDSGEPLNISSKQIKQLWKQWFDNNLMNNDWDIDIKEYLEYDFPEADISGYIDDEYFELRQDFLDLFSNECREQGFLKYNDLLFASFVHDLFYFGESLVITNLDLSEMAHFDLSERDDLPSKSGLYFVIKNEQIYAFGITQNFYKHWEKHKILNKLKDIEGIKIVLMLIKSQRYLHSITEEFIKTYIDKLNLDDNPILQSSSN
jgi:hypothetical protein